MAAAGVGSAEMIALLLFLSGLGVPLGVPPARENPAMAHVAPERCVLYSTWAAMAAADPQSANHTEQLLAEPEVREFVRALEKSVQGGMKPRDGGAANPQSELLAQLVPSLGKTLFTRSAAVFINKIAVPNNTPQIEGGLLVDAGEDGKLFADLLVKLLTSPQARPAVVTLGGEKFQRFAARDDDQSEITIGTSGTYLLVGPGSVEGMLQRLQAKKTPAWLLEIQKRNAFERRASISMIDAKALVETLLPLAGPEGMGIGKSLGLQQLGRIEMVTGLDKEGIVSRTFMPIDGEPEGLLTLLNGKGIKPDDVNFVPRDALIAGALSLNMRQVYDVLAKVVAENSPGGQEDVESISRLFEQRFGLRLKEDLLLSLGDVWTVSLSPVDGWGGLVATAEVRDQEKLTELLERVKGLADGPRPDLARIEATKFGNHDLQSLVVAGVPFRLTWCVAKTRLIVGLQPQAVKSTLSLKPAEQGLFSKQEVAWAFQGEGQTIGVTYQDSAKVFETFYGTLTFLLPMFTEGMNRPRSAGLAGGPAAPLFDFASLPSARSIHRHLQPSVSVTRRTKAGLEMEVRQTLPTAAASAPVGIALLLPAVQSARTAARRTQSANNLKQIMLAIHNHHDTHNAFPPQATTDKDGKPLLSWRVMILPFIEQQALYNEFHLDEPWDSEHNKALIKKMPKVYQSPASKAGEGKTVFLGVSGDDGVFPASEKPSLGARGTLGFRNVTDGTSNTIAIVEASDDSAVVWTKPNDFVPDAKNPLKGLPGLYPGGFNVGLCDGSVRFVSESVDLTTLLRLFQRSDGQPIPNF